MYGRVVLRNFGEEDEEDLVFLPPYTSKRGVWLDWIRTRGWDPLQLCNKM